MTNEWVSDANGNKCSTEYWGTKEKAQAALDSLKECRDCINCSDCSRCSRCSGCSGCSGCSDCSGLVGVTSGIKPSSFAPAIENIHQKVWEAVSCPNALEMSRWHTCETTHCRGGWVVTLAGDAGRALELFHNTALAAQLIYVASGYDINPCRFYDSNEAALADMKRLAEG